jgi:hypothetical protein
MNFAMSRWSGTFLIVAMVRQISRCRIGTRATRCHDGATSFAMERLSYKFHDVAMERRIMWWCDGATHFLLSRWNCHGRRGPFCLVPWSFTAWVKITLRRVHFGFVFNQGLHICCMVGFLAFWPVVTVVYADDIVVLPCAFSFLFLGLWFLSSWACSLSFWSKLIVRCLLIFVRQSSYMWCW